MKLYVSLVVSFFMATCFSTGCHKKNCATNFRLINFYQQVSPKLSGEYNVGDTITWHFYAPYNSIDNRNQQAVNISNTRNISKFSFSLVRIDSIERPGILVGGLKHFSLSFIKGKSPFYFTEIPYKDARVEINLEKGNDGFEVIVKAIAIRRGVFMLSHYPASGEGNCILNDFVPVLKNQSRNENIYYKHAVYNDPVTFYGSEYFFIVK
jgi:hypothetical protein